MIASTTPPSSMITSASFEIEVDRAAPAPRVVQDREQLLHLLEHRHQRRVLLQQRRIAIRQDPVHRRVGHPLVAVDDAVVELVAHDLPVAIDLHQARLHEPIDVRVQAAQPRRQLGREHVDGALGKVDRRAALVGLAVERAAFVDVVRDIRDVHAQPEVAVRQLLDRDRVVEIARVLAIDGDRDDGCESRFGHECRDPTPTRRGAPLRSPLRRSARRECRSLRMMISVSTPGASMSPSTSATRPMAPRVAVGQRVSSVGTISPGDAPPSWPGGTKMSMSDAPIERHDVAHAVVVAIVAADDPGRCSRSRMRMMRPSTRPPSLMRSMRTTTRSPCIASLRWVPGHVDVAAARRADARA